MTPGTLACTKIWFNTKQNFEHQEMQHHGNNKRQSLAARNWNTCKERIVNPGFRNFQSYPLNKQICEFFIFC
jgi:hypothetical protein